MDYAVEMYKVFFRELVKEIAKEFPDNSEDTLEKEAEYIKNRLEDEKLDFLFRPILNKDMYYRCFANRDITPNVFKINSECIENVDFRDARERNKKSGDERDLIWLLTRSNAKYPNGENISENQRNRYKQFEQLMEQLDFSDREKQIFYYSDAALYFNGLMDCGDAIYDQQGVFMTEGSRTEYLFSHALKESYIATMYDKFTGLLKLCYKTANRKVLQEMDTQTVIKVAECLSDLVPVIDKDSKLKNREQLQKDQIAIRFAVYRKFLMGGKDNNKNSGNKQWQNALVKYFNNYVLVKTLLEEVGDTNNFNEDQILVITEGYLDSLEQGLELFRDKVMQYKKACKGLLGDAKPIQAYRDMWEAVGNNRGENE